jgi:uncharacterized repeat protein (TIGR03803 family)
VLYNFDSIHGNTPDAPLIQASDGNFYGTAISGGTSLVGVVFKMTSTGKFNVLHNFTVADGTHPYGGLLQATDGKLYGASGGGGTQGCGTIFSIDRTGAFSTLYNFDGTTGCEPEVKLWQHTNGILYGDTFGGGSTQIYGVFYSFNVGLKPFASLVSTSGKVGKTIGILGQGFKGTTSVSFNGTAAGFKVVSGTYLTATVPAGATTGFVTVTTPKRKLTSNKKFRVN